MILMFIFDLTPAWHACWWHISNTVLTWHCANIMNSHRLCTLTTLCGAHAHARTHTRTHTHTHTHTHTRSSTQVPPQLLAATSRSNCSHAQHATENHFSMDQWNSLRHDIQSLKNSKSFRDALDNHYQSYKFTTTKKRSRTILLCLFLAFG